MKYLRLVLIFPLIVYWIYCSGDMGGPPLFDIVDTQNEIVNVDGDSDSDGDLDIDSDSDNDLDTDSDIDSDGDSDGDLDIDSDTDSDTDSDGDSDIYPGQPGTYYGLELVVNGETRYYGLHVPQSYSPDRPMPMLIFFHGTDFNLDPVENERRYMYYTGLGNTADRNGFILVLPTAPVVQGSNGTALAWEYDIPENDAFVQALLDHLTTQYNIDESRIYIAGFSSGGFYTAHLFVHYSTTFTAFAVFSAGTPSTYYDNPSYADRHIPGYIRVGTNDDQYFIDLARELRDLMITAGWELGVNLDYYEIPGLGHNYDSSQNQEMWNFLSQWSYP